MPADDYVTSKPGDNPPENLNIEIAKELGWTAPYQPDTGSYGLCLPDGFRIDTGHATEDDAWLTAESDNLIPRPASDLRDLVLLWREHQPKGVISWSLKVNQVGLFMDIQRYDGSGEWIIPVDETELLRIGAQAWLAETRRGKAGV